VEDWEGQIDELSPLTTTLEAPNREGQTVPVHLHSKVTEVGTLELWCLRGCLGSDQPAFRLRRFR
jgi:hypothetical protein